VTRDRGPLIRKIKAMLDARNRPIEYADGMATRMFGTAKIEWCTPDQLRRIVAALVYDQRRNDAKQ
jgi:phage gp16-like protein